MSTKILRRWAAPPRREPARDPDWGAAGWAGLGAACAFLATEAAVRPFLDGQPWLAARLVAAAALGPMVLEVPKHLAGVIHAAALGVHLTLSLLYARLLALIMHRGRLTQAIETGLVFGLAIYLVNFFVLGAAIPWLAQARGWPTALSHAVFGVTAAVLYRSLSREEDEI